MHWFLLLLLFPMVWPFIAKSIFHTRITWLEMGINIVGVVFLVSIVWFAGTYSQTHDTEIWNGQLVSKHREHGHYIESYSCNCRTTCSGSGNTRSCRSVCQTCYRDHYTVDWFANTSIGNIRFDYKDWTSRAVYALPDPDNYVKAYEGEPVSLERSYTNYVKGAPESLFNTQRALSNEFTIPTYPRVYNLYHINRVVTVRSPTSKQYNADLNKLLNEQLKTVGALKQVNLIVILTSITNANYRHAVENAWLGGKQNDVVVFIGLDQQNIVWADVMTWALNTGNENLHVELRDAINSLKQLNDPQQLSDTIIQYVKASYDRPHMEKFEYLKDRIVPPTWVLIITIILAIGGSIGLTVVFHRIDFRLS